MVTALLLGAIQVGGWLASPQPATVGDTVVLTRRLAADATVQVRVPALEATPEVEPLVDPVVRYAEGFVTVRHALAFFRPGTHAVPFPDIELVHSDGRVERVSGDTARVVIGSVLPPDDSQLAPQPVLEPLARSLRRRFPLVTLVGSAAALTLLWGASRRRVRPRPAWNPTSRPKDDQPLAAWVEAGELRSVAAVAATRLRTAIQRELPEIGPHLSTGECLDRLTQKRPDWPLDEIGSLLRSLDRARFAPLGPSDILALVTRVEDLGVRLMPSQEGAAE